jgi:hypothetical protein
MQVFKRSCLPKLGLMLLPAMLWASQVAFAQTTLYSFESGVAPWTPNGGEDTTPPTLSQGTIGATHGVSSLKWATFSPVFQGDFSYSNDGGASFSTLQSNLPASGRIALDITIPSDGGFTSDFLGITVALNDDGGFQPSGQRFLGGNPGTYQVEFDLAEFWTQPATWTFSELNIAMNTNPGPGFAGSTVYVDNIRLLPPEPPKMPLTVYEEDFDCAGGSCDPGQTANFYRFSEDITPPAIAGGVGVDGSNALQWQILGPGLDTVGGVGVNNRLDGTRIIGAPVVPTGQASDFKTGDFVVSFDLKADADLSFVLEFRTDDPDMADVGGGGSEVPSRFYYIDEELLSITPADGWKHFELNLEDASFNQNGTNGFRPDLANLIQLNFAPDAFDATTTILMDNLSFDYLVPIEGTPGDFNGDKKVDAADYTVWRDNFGSDTALPNDNNLGTPIAAAHYELWKSNFGLGGSGSNDGSLAGSAAPEPSTFAMTLLSVAGILLATNHRRANDDDARKPNRNFGA